VNGGYSTLESNDKEVAAPTLAGVGRSHHQDAVCSQQLRYYLILAKKEVWNGTGKMSQIAQQDSGTIVRAAILLCDYG
jgi:hypothetical protein